MEGYILYPIRVTQGGGGVCINEKNERGEKVNMLKGRGVFFFKNTLRVLFR